MDINHPLYYALKEYYTNLDSAEPNSTKFIDNNLLLQYIEDTCDMDKNDNNYNNYFKTFKSCYLVYFANTKISKSLEYESYFVESMELYCYFTNKYLNKFDSYVNSIGYVGKYRFIICIINRYKILYLFE
jgi:hypothetical protein